MVAAARMVEAALSLDGGAAALYFSVFFVKLEKNGPVPTSFVPSVSICDGLIRGGLTQIMTEFSNFEPL
jgi:hypothetical protein